MMKISVFTPTFNRAGYLSKIYGSLIGQTANDFEWIVVDDGSTDDTKTVMDGLTRRPDHVFPIHYIYKENGGKHTAINRGVREAKGELFWILDSDDTLPPDALSTVIGQYEPVQTDRTIGGVCGLMAHHDGKLIGSGFPKNNIVASSIDLRFRYHVTGDLMEVFKTSVLREFPFPEIAGERFCPEQLVWFRIAQKYKLKCFNKVIYYRDYLEGGLTDNMVNIRMKSPIASTMCYAELNALDVPLPEKLKAAINYWRFRFCVKKGHPASITWPWYCVAPFGLLFHLKDLKTIKQ